MKYQIKGEPMPVVICELEAGESMITEKGSMAWMSPNIRMETSAGGAGKAFGRLFSGEHIFQNVYTAEGGPGTIAFASSFPGGIIAIEVTPDKPIIAQKTAFLASTRGVELSVHFKKNVATGLFGGEGFIMQRISGNGLVFLEIDGSMMEYDLGPGQSMVVDSGYVAMCDATVQMDVQTVKGAKNIIFGGEGLFNTVLTGPGKVTLQTQPMSKYMATIQAALPSK